MYKIRDNKWNRRFCRWMASLLMAALVVNQSSILVLAEEVREEKGADTVTVTEEETENPGESEGKEDSDADEDKNADADADTAPDNPADEETEDSDAGEGENTDVDIDADTDDVSDVDAEDEVNTLLQDDEAANVVGEDVVSPAAVGSFFSDSVLWYTIINENDRQVEVMEPPASVTPVSGAIVIPPTVTHGGNEYEVVGIGEWAFRGCSSLTSIIIPDSVTSIAKGAFQRCESLESITIPNGVVSIEDYTFYECSSLANITIPDSVTSIGNSVFSGCSSLGSITVPDKVTSIGDSAFIGCSNLANITIPDSVSSIGTHAFHGCSSLESITIPYGVTSIEFDTFYGCTKLIDVTIPDSVTRIDDQAFRECSSLTSITIPDSVTSIGQGAFNSCSSLTNITIPSSVTSIEWQVFANCSSLTSITIPDSVPSIGMWTFAGCNSLEKVIILNDNITIAHDAFNNCGLLSNLQIAIKEPIAGTPAVESEKCFEGCPDDRSLTFLREDGTAVLSDETALAAAVKAYDEADYFNNGKWYGWKLPDAPEIPDVTDYPVTIKVNKDGSEWSDCEKKFVLSSDHSTYIDVFTAVPIGTYAIYEKIETADSGVGYVDTGVTVEVIDRAVEVEVNYYTVTFYNGDDVFREQIVLNNTKVSEPTDIPTKDGYTFGGWVTSEDGSTEFNFEDLITAKTSIYAKWVIAPVTCYPVTINVNVDDSAWSDCGKTFALLSDNGGTFIKDFTAVPIGTYAIYEKIETADSGVSYVDTGVTVEVIDRAVEVEVNYYTVTFYDGDTIFSGQIVPKNEKVSAPSVTPTKDGYTFYRWVTSKDGSTEFDFNNPITAKTDIYASWIMDAEEFFTITASAGAGGSVTPSGSVPVKSGADQRFTITPQEGYRVSSILVDDVEVLNSTQAPDYAKAGITDAGDSAKYYDFENVTGNHTLSAAFEVVNPGGGGSGGSGGGGNTGGGSGGSGDNSGSDNSGGSTTVIKTEKNVITYAGTVSGENAAPASKDSEPKTGDASHMEIYATIAMIAGLTYILLYFADGKSGMTEEEKQEIVAALVKWAKKGSRVKKYVALAVIFLVLVYYHSIGKRTSADWKEIYEN